MKFDDLAILVVSIGAIAIGCVCKNFSYTTGITFTSASGKRAPTWMGRLGFIGIGILLLVPELVHLFSN